MGYIVSVSGVKDGLGKSVFSANFALSLMLEAHSRVLYIDLDVDHCGDSNFLFGEENIATIATLMPFIVKKDAQSVIDGITKHKKTELRLLKLYQSPEELKVLDEKLIGPFFKLLRNHFSFVIIDAGSSFSYFKIKACELSSLIFFLVTPDVCVISQAQRKLQAFQNAQISRNLINIIFNKYDPQGPIDPGIVGKKLKKEVLLTIPLETAPVAASVFNGDPLILSAPRSAVSSCINQLSGFFLKDSVLKSLPVPTPDDKNDPETLKTVNYALSIVQDLGSSRNSAEAFKPKTNDEFAKETEFKLKVHKRLLEIVDLKKVETEAEASKDEKKIAELREQTMSAVNRTVDEFGSHLSQADKKRMAKEVLDEAVGLGPLEDLLADPGVNEIMVNRKDQIYVEKDSRLQLTSLRFSSDKHLRSCIDRIVAPTGRRIDEKSPYVDSRLKDGSRVHAIIPPLALKGCAITIRKFKKEKLTYKDMVKYGTITEQMADFLRAVIESRLNCIISGGTGTGKTTMLNILGSFIPTSERIVTVEDSAELQLPQEHIITLETRPPNIKGEGEVSIRDLVRNTLRMRPDRIVVGECRGAEALDMLQAMNTGHDGSLTTLHSNNPRDCLQRIETLVMFAGYDMPSKAIKEMISSAVNMIIQLNRMSDGSRKITHITEITGMEGQAITSQDIFLYKQTGVDSKGKVTGNFQATGLIPKFVQGLKEKGIRIPAGLFSGKMEV